MGNKKVVVIDNDANSLKVLEEIIDAVGHEPVPVSDALAAVDIVLQKKPAVILLELKMPKKNGFELVDEINQVFKPRRIPIIAMSEFFKEKFKFLLRLYGINRFLKKPIRPLNAIWAIENIIDDSNQNDKARQFGNRNYCIPPRYDRF